MASTSQRPVHPGWEVQFLECGGRLRSVPLAQSLGDDQRRALGQAALFATSGADEEVDHRAQLVAFLLRRLLGRGLLPPVDPDLEEQLLTVAGLRPHAHRSSHRGDLSLVLDEEVRNRLGDDPMQPDVRWLLWAPVVAQRIALGLSEAIGRGWLRGECWSVCVDEPMGVALPAVRAAAETISALASIWRAPLVPDRIVVHHGGHVNQLRCVGEGCYAVEPAVGARHPAWDATRLTVDPFRELDAALPGEAEHQVVLRSAPRPGDLVDARPPGGARPAVDAADAIPGWALRRLLRALFAKCDFQPAGPRPRAQEAAIRRLLAGRDSVVLLPTGAGKSLIYQFTGLLKPGLTLVIDPIVSLIEDQLDGLRRQGIDRAVGISAENTRDGSADEKLAQIQSGGALFAFVAPERMQQLRFRESLRLMSRTTPISLVVADEAHCVSEWGHDFRASYLDLGRVLRNVAPDTNGVPAPLLALTGTASRAVLRDMLLELDVDRADPGIVISPRHFDRPELHFAVVDAEDRALIPRLVSTIEGLPRRFRGSGVPRFLRDFLRPRGGDSACGIVFCQTVSGRHGVKAVADILREALQVDVPMYSGSAPRGVANYEQVKRRNAVRFKQNEATLLVATKSYGMGIDKPNVRYVIHVGIPASIESYYQEAGRAGRDRGESVCVILHTRSGRRILDWFHQRSFQGAERELHDVAELLEALGPIGEPGARPVPFAEADGRRERAIHRLKLLGVVRDYTVDWQARRYRVEVRSASREEVDAALLNFVRRNHPGRVSEFARLAGQESPEQLDAHILSRARLMIGYVYETIVAARTHAVDEMERLANEGRSDEVIRDRILRHLALGGVAESLEKLLDRERFDFADWSALLDTMECADDAREWRGATARLLESDPDNPGLLLGRGLSEAVLVDGDAELFSASARQAIRSAVTRGAVQDRALASMMAWLSRWIGHRRAEWRPLLFAIAEQAHPAASLALLEPLEMSALLRREADAGELVVVLARRLGRISARLRGLANAALETA